MRILLYVDRQASPDDLALAARLRRRGHSVGYRNSHLFRELEPCEQVQCLSRFAQIVKGYTEAGIEVIILDADSLKADSEQGEEAPATPKPAKPSSSRSRSRKS